jgi:hypothetical protein
VAGEAFIHQHELARAKLAADLVNAGDRGEGDLVVEVAPTEPGAEDAGRSLRPEPYERQIILLNQLLAIDQQQEPHGRELAAEVGDDLGVDHGLAESRRHFHNRVPAAGRPMVHERGDRGVLIFA